MTDVERKDHTVSGTNTPTSPLPPPSSSRVEPVAPTMPAAQPNLVPHVARQAGDRPAPVTAAPPRRGPSRAKVYGIAAAVFLVLSVIGYFGFREYIYGDDAPPIPVLDE